MEYATKPYEVIFDPDKGLTISPSIPAADNRGLNFQLASGPGWQIPAKIKKKKSPKKKAPAKPAKKR